MSYESERYALLESVKSWWVNENGWRIETLNKMKKDQLLAVRGRMLSAKALKGSK